MLSSGYGAPTKAKGISLFGQVHLCLALTTVTAFVYVRQEIFRVR